MVNIAQEVETRPKSMKPTSMFLIGEQRKVSQKKACHLVIRKNILNFENRSIFMGKKPQ
jgi:hypothetical protein